VELGWPPPPRAPIIVFEQSIYGTHSLQRSFLGRVKDFVFGKSPDLSLDKPYGMTYDGHSKLYVADTGKKGVAVLDFQAGSMRRFSSLGAQGRLAEPVNIILDQTGNLYVADTGLGRVAVLDPDGEFTRFVGAAGDLEAPVGMAFTRDQDMLYVVDARLHLVKIFDVDHGHLVGSFGGRGDQRGEFYHPLGIAISATDTVYVVDAFHFAVQAFDLEGRFLFSFGPTTNGIGTMARPRGIAIDSDNQIYVTDALNHNVQIYDSRGKLRLTFGAQGLGTGQFRLPAGICITSENRIYVADSINRRIQEFRYLSEG
jgi:DNA-binding beta-propeller fold protein YncE